MIAARQVKWVMTGWSLTITRDEALKFYNELSTKVDEYIKNHPNLSDQTKEYLREFTVHVGMAKEEVQLLLGEPLEKITAPEKLPGMAREEWRGTEEGWLYRVDSSTFNNAISVLYFHKDSLTHIVEYGHYYLLKVGQ